MKRTMIAAALAAGFALPAAASVLDFTADNATAGTVMGVNWTVTASPGSLVNSVHGNNAGCTGQGWDFACAGGNGSYDVGFGVNGDNNNEIDGIQANEYVEVSFDSFLTVTGFAGMLTYANSSLQGDREQVLLEYHTGGGVWESVLAEPEFTIGSSFDTVGLAFSSGLSLFTDMVRFKATGTGNSDDGSFNVTAAGLEVSVIPVPAAFPLLLAGVGALGWAARRKKRMDA
jgi:hypothetical protein